MRLLWVLSFAVCFSCAPEHAVQGRPYELTLPASDDGSPLPLVILAHGYGVNGVGQDFLFPFSKIVDSNRFLYAEPHGTQDRAGRRFWNATDQCCNFEKLPVDDVGFFRALIDDVKATHAVKKVFVVGHSNGGFMALRLACEASDAIDGVVSVSGSTWNDFTRCPSGRVIPLLLVHGTVDGTIPYEGAPDRYPGAIETGRRFARRAGCTGTWEEYERSDFVSSVPDAETKRERFTGCSTAPIELWTMEGEGHAPVFDERWTRATVTWLQENAP
jgi:polyhydroxybutyrate depolymerase